MDVRRALPIFWILLLGACGAPLPYSGQGGGGGGGSQLNDLRGPCLEVKADDADCDDDGLSDACEELLGNNTCDDDTDKDGIKDGSDCPQNDPTCETVKDDFYNQFINQYGPSLLASNAAFSGSAPSGTQIQITEQRLRLVSSQNPEDDLSLCAGVAKPYLYLSIVGTVTLCTSQGGDPTLDCQSGQPQQARVDLCSKTLSFDPAQPVSNGTTLSMPASFDWEKGQAYSVKSGLQRFDTRLLDPKKSTEKSLKIEVTQLNTVNGMTHAKKIRTTFKAAMKLDGSILSPDGSGTVVGNITSSALEVSKNWQFYNSGSSIRKGMLGIFAN